MACRCVHLQDILAAGSKDTDLSGNPILQDVGVWMRNELKSNFKNADIKYIDPSYIIRSCPTISNDRIYCKARLARLCRVSATRLVVGSFHVCACRGMREVKTIKGQPRCL